MSDRWVLASTIALTITVGASTARAYTANDLYGTWTGTQSFSPTATILDITTNGTSTYSPPSGFYDPQSWQCYFEPSTNFAFGFQWGSASSPPGFYWVPRTQTSADQNGSTFTWDTDVDDPLSGGGSFTVAKEHYVAALQTDPSNPQQLLLTGEVTESDEATSLPSGVGDNDFIFISDRSFSMGTKVPLPSSVPLPSAAWMGLGLLAALGLITALRSRLARAA